MKIMKKIVIVILILLLILIIAGLIVYYTQIGKTIKQPLNNNTNSAKLQIININSEPVINSDIPQADLISPITPDTSIINTNSNQPDYQPVSISINNFSFNPKQRTVKIGTTVTWTNDDPAPHKIESTIFSSQTLNTGDSFSYTFNQAGNFDYYCSIHPSMKGQISVK